MGRCDWRKGNTGERPRSAVGRALAVSVSMIRRVRGHAFVDEDTDGGKFLENISSEKVVQDFSPSFRGGKG